MLAQSALSQIKSAKVILPNSSFFVRKTVALHLGHFRRAFEVVLYFGFDFFWIIVDGISLASSAYQVFSGLFLEVDSDSPAPRRRKPYNAKSFSSQLA